MYVVVRSYSGGGASDLFDALAEKSDDVQNVMRTVPGLVSYSAFRTDRGGQALAVCQDKAGADESSRRAGDWVKQNVSVPVDPPTVSEGTTVVHL